MMTKKQIEELQPLPFEPKVAYSRFKDGGIVPQSMKVWGQDSEGKWGFKNHSPRFKNGKYERGFYPVPKKKK